MGGGEWRMGEPGAGRKDPPLATRHSPLTPVWKRHMAKKPASKKPTTKAAKTAVAVKRSGAVAKAKNGSTKIAKLEPAETSRYILGSSKIFTPDVINDIHIKSELGRYRMRGFSLFKKIPHWDDLTFLPGTLTRFVIEGYREKCETKTIIVRAGEETREEFGSLLTITTASNR